jgi:hypothetical protein
MYPKHKAYLSKHGKLRVRSLKEDWAGYQGRVVDMKGEPVADV